jgi:transglutaminase-like putative cysteine protease
MNRIAGRIALSVGLVITLMQFSPQLLQVGSLTVLAMESNAPIEDIQAAEFPAEFLKSGSKNRDNQYIHDYNMAVDDYNTAQYSKALPILKELIVHYQDNRKSLYLWAVCMGEELSKKSDYSGAIAYYKAALNIQKETFVQHNTVYCYLQLAEQLKKPDRIAMLLYGYQFIAKSRLQDDSLETLAVNLGNELFAPPLAEYFPAAILCIQAALVQNDNPYLHQTLGLIYLYQNNSDLAKAEFKRVVDDYPNSPFYASCLERFNNIGNADYQYQAVYPIKVSANTRGAATVTAKIMLQIPQSYRYQAVKNLQVSLNHQAIQYQIVTDQFGTRFLQLNISKRFSPGMNRLVVEAEVEVADKRIQRESIVSIRVGEYRQNEIKYQLWTHSTETINLKNPQIQKMAAEIRRSVQSDRLVDLVQGVYQYVMRVMSYQDTLRTDQKVGVKRALENMQSAVCEDYAIITVALLRSLKIPAGYFSGDYYGSQIGHAWAVFFTPDYQPIPLDTTWGDTSKIPDLLFLANSNSLVTTSFSCESTLMPDNINIHFECSSDPGVQIQMGRAQLKLVKQPDPSVQ